MTSGSRLSASTMAVPTMTGSSGTMSAHNCSSASAHVSVCLGQVGQGAAGPGPGEGRQCRVGRSMKGLDSPFRTPALDPAQTGTKLAGAVVAVSDRGGGCPLGGCEWEAGRVARSSLCPQKAFLVTTPRTLGLTNTWMLITLLQLLGFSPRDGAGAGWGAVV